jgi:hypothetical protein
MMQAIRKDYDKEAKVLYLSVGQPRPAISRHYSDGILVRLDVSTKEFLGVTVFDFKTTKEKEYEKTLNTLSEIPHELLIQIIAALRAVSAKR